eukprot:4069221-Pleurochrysis_carterae.AAC.4
MPPATMPTPPPAPPSNEDFKQDLQPARPPSQPLTFSTPPTPPKAFYPSPPEMVPLPPSPSPPEKGQSEKDKNSKDDDSHDGDDDDDDAYESDLTGGRRLAGLDAAPLLPDGARAASAMLLFHSATSRLSEVCMYAYQSGSTSMYLVVPFLVAGATYCSLRKRMMATRKLRAEAVLPEEGSRGATCTTQPRSVPALLRRRSSNLPEQ